MEEDHGAHSPRRAKASIISKPTGDPRPVRILLGHTKIERTVRSGRRGVRRTLVCAKP
jgi:hypothetical protein